MAASAMKERIAWIDRLRGLAVLGMFLVHSGPPWLAPEHRTGAYAAALDQIAGLVAPVFLFLAGAAMALAAGRGARKRRAVVRGLQILGAGYGLSLAFFALRGFGRPDLLFRVDVLHCIGATMALLALVAWPKGRVNLVALAAFLALLLGAQLTWRLSLGDVLPGPVAGYLTRHAGHSLFPLLPYGAWIALGLFVGPLWFAARDAGRERRFLIGLAATAVAFGGLSFVAGLAERASGLSALPAADGRPVGTQVSFFLFKAALVFALLLLARLLERPLAAWKSDPLLLWGRRSLFAYCVHLVLIFHGLAWLLRGRLSPPSHLAATAGLAAVMWALTLAWERWGPGGHDAARTTDSTLRTPSASQGR
jgi:uncharacterized membrane protein